MYAQREILTLRVVHHFVSEERVALREGHPRRKYSRHMIGYCLTLLGFNDLWVDLKITWEALSME